MEVLEKILKPMHSVQISNHLFNFFGLIGVLFPTFEGFQSSEREMVVPHDFTTSNIHKIYIER